MFFKNPFRLSSNRIPYGSILLTAGLIFHQHVSAAPLLDALDAETPTLSTQTSGVLSSDLAPGVYIAPFNNIPGAELDDSASRPVLVKSFDADELKELARYFSQDHSSTKVSAPDSIKLTEDPLTDPHLIPYTTPNKPLVFSKDQLQSPAFASRVQNNNEPDVVCDRNKIHPFLHHEIVVLPGLQKFWNGLYIPPGEIFWVVYEGNFIFVCNLGNAGTFLWADAYRLIVDPMLQRECGHLVTGEVYYSMLSQSMGRGVRGERVCWLKHRL